MSEEQRDFAAEIAALSVKIMTHMLNDDSAINDEMAGEMAILIRTSADYIATLQAAAAARRAQVATLTGGTQAVRGVCPCAYGCSNHTNASVEG